MSTKEQIESPSIEPPFKKDCWPLYSLQALSPSRFVDVVGKVVDGRYQLLNARTPAQAQ